MRAVLRNFNDLVIGTAFNHYIAERRQEEKECR